MVQVLLLYIYFTQYPEKEVASMKLYMILSDASYKTMIDTKKTAKKVGRK